MITPIAYSLRSSRTKHGLQKITGIQGILPKWKVFFVTKAFLLENLEIKKVKQTKVSISERTRMPVPLIPRSLVE